MSGQSAAEPIQATLTDSTAVANYPTANSSSSNVDAAPVFQSKRPLGRPRKQVSSEFILQRKKVGYFPGRPRGSVRVRRKPASLEEGVGGPGSSMGSLAGSVPSPSPGGIGTPAPTPAVSHTTPPGGQSSDEPELAEGLVQGALTTTTTAAIIAGPPELVEDSLCGLCNPKSKHMNYTVCDVCSEQRKKGMSCPLCGKAYRASSSSKMVDFTQCSTCKRFVHNDCDPLLMIGNTGDSRQYTCPPCLDPCAKADDMLFSWTPSLPPDRSRGAEAPYLSPVTLDTRRSHSAWQTTAGVKPWA